MPSYVTSGHAGSGSGVGAGSIAGSSWITGSGATLGAGGVNRGKSGTGVGAVVVGAGAGSVVVDVSGTSSAGAGVGRAGVVSLLMTSIEVVGSGVFLSMVMAPPTPAPSTTPVNVARAMKCRFRVMVPPGLSEPILDQRLRLLSTFLEQILPRAFHFIPLIEPHVTGKASYLDRWGFIGEFDSDGFSFETRHHRNGRDSNLFPCMLSSVDV